MYFVKKQNFLTFCNVKSLFKCNYAKRIRSKCVILIGCTLAMSYHFDSLKEKNMKYLVFIKQPNGKFTFSVYGDANATAYLLKNTIAHSINESGIKFARPALLKLLEQYDPNVDYTVVEESSMIKLNDFATSFFNGGLVTEIHTLSNFIEAVIMLPDGHIFSGTGRNQRLAHHKAAKKGYEFYNIK